MTVAAVPPIFRPSGGRSAADSHRHSPSHHDRGVRYGDADMGLHALFCGGLLVLEHSVLVYSSACVLIPPFS